MNTVKRIAKSQPRKSPKTRVNRGKGIAGSGEYTFRALLATQLETLEAQIAISAGISRAILEARKAAILEKLGSRR